MGIQEYRLRARSLKPGFYLFRIGEGTWDSAIPVREAMPEERDEAMKGCPEVNAVTTMYDEKRGAWWCHPLNLNQVQGMRDLHWPAPLLIPDGDLSLLQPVKAWVKDSGWRKALVHRGPHTTYPAESLDKLRDLLPNPASPDKPPFPVTSEEMEAYSFARRAAKPPVERLIEESLRFVGAKLLKYQALADGQYRVTYEHQGDEDSVTVNQEMRVLDAGICLVDQRTGQHYAGHGAYDLASIVLVKHRRN